MSAPFGLAVGWFHVERHGASGTRPWRRCSLKFKYRQALAPRIASAAAEQACGSGYGWPQDPQGSGGAKL